MGRQRRVKARGENCQPEEREPQKHAGPRQGDRGVAGLRLAEGGDAVGDRLDAGQRDRPRREGLHQGVEGDPGDEGAVASEVVELSPVDRKRVKASGERAEESVDDQRRQRDHIGVHGHGEQPARLLQAPEVDQHDERDQTDAERNGVAPEGRDG